MAKFICRIISPNISLIYNHTWTIYKCKTERTIERLRRAFRIIIFHCLSRMLVWIVHLPLTLLSLMPKCGRLIPPHMNIGSSRFLFPFFTSKTSWPMYAFEVSSHSTHQTKLMRPQPTMRTKNRAKERAYGGRAYLRPPQTFMWHAYDPHLKIGF